MWEPWLHSNGETDIINQASRSLYSSPGLRTGNLLFVTLLFVSQLDITRIIQSLYYAPAGRYSANRGRSIIRVKLDPMT